MLSSDPARLKMGMVVGLLLLAVGVLFAFWSPKPGPRILAPIWIPGGAVMAGLYALRLRWLRLHS
jgi:hypothetical protein